ncbi:MAG: nitrous oxide reductase family maturation protein NosD [Ardenticatenaceae bacterium]|nr:nitrous oxide reductase family maturation protein NosD [Ardenticatenaceae bacterium]
MKRLGLLVVLVWLVGVGRVMGLATAVTHTIPAAELAAALSQAAPGDTIVVTGGVYAGHLTIDKSVTLIGQDWPVIDGGGAGTVVNITAPNSTIQGFVIRDSGRSLDEENAGLVAAATDITIAENRFEETLFGIYLLQAHNSIIRDNFITSKELDMPRRGDGIRVWESNDVLIEGNEVWRARDVVLWYSTRLTIRDNEVRDGRYGLHFMYCDDAHIVHNRLLNNSVGAFLMYSRRLHMEQNTIAHNRGPSGYGIGMKDLDDAAVSENLFLDNRVGTYLDGSPREVDSVGLFTGNVFAYNDIGVEMLPAVRHNHFEQNSFVENEEQMSIAGGGQPGANVWAGNYWSDYAGYDANGDGVGDIAYKSERLFENVMQREPNLRLFLYSPATGAIDLAARAFPLVKPQPKLVDERPLLTPLIPTAAPALPASRSHDWVWLAAGLLAAALVWHVLPQRWQRQYSFPQRAPLNSPKLPH